MNRAGCYGFARLGLCALLLANPALGMSKKKEMEVGREMYQKVTAEVGIYQNEKVRDYVSRVGQLLASNSDMPELEFTFTVLDSEDINAFATPGGYIYMNRGLLAYLDSEAELAAVLSHEISHVTERHASRQEWMGKASNVASAVAGILVAIQTGSGAAGGVTQDTANVAGTAMVMGYGRDMELEADRVGARYMHRVGYDPQAMVAVLTVLKEQESFMKARARKEGKKAVAYHGVFSTHPANDDRLKEVIDAAGKLPAVERRQIDPDEFRAITEGLNFSEQPRASAIIGNRYYNGKLGFTLAFPTDWKIVKRAGAVLAGPNRDGTILQMLVKRAKPELTPGQFAVEVLKLQQPQDEERINSDEVIGTTARYANAGGAPQRRVAVLYFGSNAYIFDGRTGNMALAPFYDSLFLSTVRSFRPMTEQDRAAVLGINVHYMRAPEGISFARLAEISPIKPYAEEMLRLVNGYYPRGEPQTGEWIKVFQ